MKKENTYKMKKYLFLLLLLIPLCSAAPYQLNLTTGILTDLNTTNETINITIYIINTTNIQNITWNNYTNYSNITQEINWVNITNITNTTCLNCTNNYTNYTNLTTYKTTYSINGTEVIFYNKAEVDAKFKTIADFNTFDSGINTKVNAINQSIEEDKKPININRKTLLWILSILGVVFGLIALVIYLRAAMG